MTGENTGHIYSVSKLTREIKSLLEDAYPFIWVAGEISNYAEPASGHAYFTLKDENAVIRSVMFKNQKFNLKFNPENGLKVFGLARLTLYEPRGSYQLVFEHLEPEGTGSLQLAFEQLKKKMSQNGIFSNAHKKSIPFVPLKTAVITSETGAAVRDIINISLRRYNNCHLDIIPVQVQGPSSEKQICHAIDFVNKNTSCDLIILARGGGSLEDLSSFNSESVAMAIFNSDIPVITGIGHETDFTIADFVADLRAPTPSAAAELALPDKAGLIDTVTLLQARLSKALKTKIVSFRDAILHLKVRLKTPESLIHDYHFRLDDLISRLEKSIQILIQHQREKLNWLTQGLYSHHLLTAIQAYKIQISVLIKHLNQCMDASFERSKLTHLHLLSELESLSPASTLNRGYSITQLRSDKTLVMSSEEIQKNDSLEIILAKGKLLTRVEEKYG